MFEVKTIEHDLCVGGVKEGKKVEWGHPHFRAPARSYACFNSAADPSCTVDIETYYRASVGNGRRTVHKFWCKEGIDPVDRLIEMASEDRWILSEDTIHTLMSVVNWCKGFKDYGPHDPEKLKSAMDELYSKYTDAHMEMRYR